MRKSWIISVDGRIHTIDAEWGVPFTSRGKAFIDGVLVATWWSKIKFPGVTEHVPFAGRDIAFRQTLGSFEIDLRHAPGVLVVRGTPATRGGSLMPWVVTFSLLLAVLAGVLGLLAGR